MDSRAMHNDEFDTMTLWDRRMAQAEKTIHEKAQGSPREPRDSRETTPRIDRC